MRYEYPRPDFVRDNFITLNGEWDFEIASKNASLLNKDELDGKINVPFCPESSLSGVNYTGFINHCYYRKSFEVDTKKIKNKCVILHIGASDYYTKLYVNKRLVTLNKGGYISFSVDIAPYLIRGMNTIDIEVIDDTKDNMIPSGKQSKKKESYGCMYTRTTGIWQSVWLEVLEKCHIKNVKIDTNIHTNTLTLDGRLSNKNATALSVKVLDNGESVFEGSLDLDKTTRFNVDIQLDNVKLWSPKSPNLYDIEMVLYSNDNIVDKVTTYCGFREITLDNNNLYINGKKVVLKQVLDQGFYEEGIYTAPKVEDIFKDIELGLSFGFNGARPHEKIFDPYYLYYADKRGYLIFGEYPNWGTACTEKNEYGVNNIVREWKKAVMRDYNHPSIIGWCPLNEAWAIMKDNKCDNASQTKLYDITKKLDSSRIIIGSSGGDFYKTDVYDIHTYSHDSKKLAKQIQKPSSIPAIKANRLKSKKQMKESELESLPKFLSEYGGLTYLAEGKSWGYSKQIQSEEEFVSMFTALTQTAIDSEIMGLCYTQLYDVEQEQNGLLRYDRTHKLSSEGVEEIRKCLLESDYNGKYNHEIENVINDCDIKADDVKILAIDDYCEEVEEIVENEPIVEEETTYSEPIEEQAIQEDTAESVIEDEEEDESINDLEDEDDEEDIDLDSDSDDEDEDSYLELIAAAALDKSGNSTPREVKQSPNFIQKLKMSSIKNKDFYVDIKNALSRLKGTTFRISKRVEKVRYQGKTIAVMSVSAKAIRLCLALDPTKYDVAVYRHKDLSEKTSYKSVPMQVMVGTKKALTRALFLIDELMVSLDMTKKPRYVDKELQELAYTVKNNGLLKIKRKDLLREEIHSHDVDILSNDDLDRIVETKTIAHIDAENFVTIKIDLLEENFQDGQKINLAILKRRGLVGEEFNGYKVMGSGKLTKPLIVEANEFSSTAAKMIAITGGRVIVLSPKD